MATGPSIVRKTRQQIVSKAEKFIDRCIRDDVSGEVTISTKLLPERFDIKDWEDCLRPKYIKAGWKKAAWVSDQRDGDYIHLIS